jgi:hypothetical protein
MNKLYIQNDPKECVNLYVYSGNTDILRILDNYMITSYPEFAKDTPATAYKSWWRSGKGDVRNIRIIKGEMVQDVINFSNVVDWEVVIVENGHFQPDPFIESCKEL